MASTDWGKAGYYAPLPTPAWKTREGFFLQEFLVGMEHGKEELRINHGLVCQYDAYQVELDLQTK